MSRQAEIGTPWGSQCRLRREDNVVTSSSGFCEWVVWTAPFPRTLNKGSGWPIWSEKTSGTFPPLHLCALYHGSRIQNMNGHSNRDWAVELCLVFENGVEGGLMFIFLCLSRSQWTSPLKGASHYQSVCLYSLTSSFCGSWSSQTSCSEEVIALRTFMLSCCIDLELEWAFSSHASLCYCGYSLFPDLEEKKPQNLQRLSTQIL